MIEQSSEPTPDEICAVLARELRSPLSTIAGHLHLLSTGSVGPVTDEQREFPDVVSRNGDRLTVAVDDWHELTRLEAGRLELARGPVDFEEIADRAVGQLRARIRSKEQQVSVEVEGAACVVTGDGRALLRVVGNLLSNAHKYTPPGGVIRVVVGRGPDVTVRLDVTDTGIGLRDEDQPHLFRKIFRAHLTDSEPGSGLGLALSRAFVERMGGGVSVRSALGQGSTFSIVLPGAVQVDVPAQTPGPTRSRP